MVASVAGRGGCQRVVRDKSGVKGCRVHKRNARGLSGGIVWLQEFQKQQRCARGWQEINQVSRVAGYIRGVPEGCQEE